MQICSCQLLVMFSVPCLAQAASVTQLQVRMDAAEKQLEDVHTETAGNNRAKDP